MVTITPYLWKKNINSSWWEETGVGGNKKRLLRLSEKTSITRVTTSVRFRARAGKPWEVRCDTSTL